MSAQAQVSRLGVARYKGMELHDVQPGTSSSLAIKGKVLVPDWAGWRMPL